MGERVSFVEVPADDLPLAEHNWDTRHNYAKVDEQVPRPISERPSQPLPTGIEQHKQTLDFLSRQREERPSTRSLPRIVTWLLRHPDIK